MPPMDQNSDADEQNVSISGNLILDEAGVRPPIAPVRQILNPNPISPYSGPYVAPVERNDESGSTEANEVNLDPFRDFRAETILQEGGEDNQENRNAANRRTLDSIFRPPFDLIQMGTFANVREAATSSNKWLLVNIQDGREFACQTLNRDVWSHRTIKDIIRENFIFWQVYREMYEGQRYAQFYRVNKWPHVAIIDPRTGEQMRAWPTSIDQTSFCDSVIDFLADFPSPSDGARGCSGSTDAAKPGEGACSLEQQILAREGKKGIISTRITREESARMSLDLSELDIETNGAFDAGPSNCSRPAAQSVSVRKDGGNNAKTNPRDPRLNQTYPKPAYGFGPIKIDTITAADELKAITAGKSKIKGPECKIALRFPDGSTHIQKFSVGASLKEVENLVRLSKAIAKACEIEFISPPYKRLTKANMQETLEALGLCPASRLEVHIVGELL